MQSLPRMLRFSLLASSCAIILSGFALAGAAFTRQPGVAAAFAAYFFLIVAVAALLLGRQFKRVLPEPDESTDELDLADPLADPRADPVMGTPPEDFSDLPMREEPASSEEEDALRKTQKAQALDRLRDGINHDLNNRLMVISANIDSVARQLKDQPTLQRKLLSALVASDQAAKLIAQSAAFARQGEHHVQYMDVAERVSSVAALMGRSMLRDTVELRLSVEEDLWPIKADPDDFETAIVTLSAHARDALTQGGTITLEARNVQVGKGSLSNLTLEGDFVQLAIRSTGLDEPLQDTEVFSEQSFALRDLDLSSWFNLRQSLRFLQALGGTSEIRRNGDETLILLYFPRADASTLLMSSAQESEDEPNEAVPDHTEILVVDDEVEVALAFQATLEEYGYVTSIATDAGQAMKSLRVRRPGLVLTDVTMPGTMNGVMLAREVRQIFPDLPVLLITGNPVIADEDSEFPLLLKPIISRDLHAAIQRHLNPRDTGKVVPLFPRGLQRRG